MRDFGVSFKYYVGQEVYVLYKNYPKKGIISEVNISIKDMDHYRNTLTPIITYKILGEWYNESKIWEDKIALKYWIDHNLCYSKYIDHKENFCYWNDKTVFLFDIIERTNNRHPWKKKKIAVIFYIDENNKGYIRYVFYNDIKNPVYEQTYLGNTRFGLMKTYGHNYIEDDIYNFVNYDGVKF